MQNLFFTTPQRRCFVQMIPFICSQCSIVSFYILLTSTEFPLKTAWSSLNPSPTSTPTPYAINSDWFLKRGDQQEKHRRKPASILKRKKCSRNSCRRSQLLRLTRSNAISFIWIPFYSKLSSIFTLSSVFCNFL